MKLSIADRLVLLNVLPRESNITTLKIVRQLKDDLSFSEEEHKKINFRNEGDKIAWDDSAIEPKEVNIGEKATDIIKASFKTLNEQKRLHIDFMDMYEKFVGPE